MKLHIFLMFMYLFELTSESYNVRKIIRQFHQQFCTIVEVGEGFCSMFIEFRPNLQSSLRKEDSVAEVFLGMCPCSTLNLWQFCNNQLFNARPQDCQFSPSAIYNSSARVHRRFCDLTSMRLWNVQCNCSHEFAGKSLSPVIGFNTCVRSPLPQSICKPRNVCGIAKCSTKTLYGAYLVECDPHCKGGQPFCEEKKHDTSQYRTTNSIWSPWGRSFCNATTGFVQSESVCVDSTTKVPAFDCLGPGMFCCPQSYPNCKCEIFVFDKVMKVQRTLYPCPMEQTQVHPTHSFLQKLLTGFLHNNFLNVSELELLTYSLDDKYNRDYRSARAAELNLTGVNSSSIIKLNQSSKHNKNKRSCKQIKPDNYSSYWEPTQHYVEAPLKERLRHSETVQQINWDELESNKDPWLAGLFLDKEDVSFYQEQLKRSNVSKNKLESFILPNDTNTSFRSNSSKAGEEQSLNFHNLFTVVYRNPKTVTSSCSMIPGFIRKNDESMLNKEKSFTDQYDELNSNNLEQNNSLIPLSEVSFINKVGNDYVYPQLIQNNVITVTVAYVNSDENEKRGKHLGSDDTSMNSSFHNALQMMKMTIPSMQVIEIDVNRFNEHNYNNLTGPHGDQNSTNNKNETMYLNLKGQIENENSSRNDGEANGANSFILPVHLEVLNISNISVSNDNIANIKNRY